MVQRSAGEHIDNLFIGDYIGSFPVVVRSGSLRSTTPSPASCRLDGTAGWPPRLLPHQHGTITFKANTRSATIPLVIVEDGFRGKATRPSNVHLCSIRAWHHARPRTRS